MIDRNQLSLDIPAYLRGDVPADIRAEIEKLAAKDADFAADIAFQRALGQSLKDGAEPPAGLEFGWARLSKAIDNEALAPVWEEPDVDPVSDTPANDQTPMRLWQYAAALLACVVIAQSFFMGTNQGSDDQYVMAGQGEAGFNMTVTMNDDASTKTLTTFLTMYEGVVATGPDGRGQYQIAFADAESCEKAQSQLNLENSLFETYSACTNG